jgi:hypothetical protein
MRAHVLVRTELFRRGAQQRRRSPTALAAALACAALAPRAAHAQPAPGDPPAQAAPQAPPGEAAAATPEEAKKRAEEHFARGLGFYEKSAWDPALAEFLASRTLYPTRSATKNAALCLRALSRYDEALDMFEALLREFPDLSDADRSAAQQSVSELSGMVGSVELRGVPIGASVTVDARAVSSTVTAGRVTERVSAGARIVRVFKDGFAPFEARPVVLAGRTVVVEVKLQALRRLADGTWGKDPLPDLAPKPPPPPPPAPPGRVVVELDLAGALTSSMGGVVDGGSGIGGGGLAALHAGYELASGIGFGITLGGLMVSQSYDGRPKSVTPRGEATLDGTVDESLRLRGALLGGHAGLHLGDRFPGLIRLGVGALVGSAADERSGTFADAAGNRFASGILEHSDSATFLYIAPEARFGYRFANRFEVSAGIAGYVLVGLGAAEWENDQLFAAGNGAASFETEELTGSVIVVLAPGLGFRADF